MHVILAVLGALIGAALESTGSGLFPALMGAAVGLGVAEFMALRARLGALEHELERLRHPAAPDSLSPPHAAPVIAPIAATFATPVAAQVTPALPKPAAPPLDAPRSARSGASVQPLELPLMAALRRFFTAGNTLVRAGVIVLFFGVAFLLRYLAEHTRIPVELRLSGVALGSIALLIVGWRLRTARSGYALALQGGGVGILYLTVFAALRLYAILPAAIAFPLLAVVAAVSAMLAVLQNSLSVALLAVTGGFLAPVLASTGHGSHVALFSYYALLNSGIVAVAWFKAWRPLNLAGFLFTFAIGTAWGVLQYRPDDFASTEPFLILFFLFYLGISILFTLRQPARLTGYVDGTLIFGTPIAVFALQSSMLHTKPLSLAYSALAMSAVYLTIAWALQRRRRESQRLMIEAWLALGVAFLTLAVPLALDARWNAATWALEGAALVWVGCRQQRILPRVFGALLTLASGGILAAHLVTVAGHLALAPGTYFGMLLQTAAALFCAGTLQAHRERLRKFEQLLPSLLFWWGVGWWVIGTLGEVHRYLPTWVTPASLIVLTVTTLLSSEFHRRTRLAAARIAALLQLPLLVAFAADAAGGATHPFAHGGGLSWPVAFAGLYCVMYRHEGSPHAPLANTLQAGSAWLLGALASWEIVWAVDHVLAGGSEWPTSTWALVPAVGLSALPWLVTRIPWPVAKHRAAYVFIAGAGAALYLAAWSVVSNLTSIPDTRPLPYVPLLNPLDLMQAVVLLVLVRYQRFLDAAPAGGLARVDPRLPMPALAVLAFLWLNAALLRTLHEWFGVPWGVAEMLRSTLVQTSLSIFWAILALVTMVMAARGHRRRVWLAGAALLAVVVAKLFVVDLSRMGSIERIVSFVGVGLLMLVVGYVSPLPPAAPSPR